MFNFIKFLTIFRDTSSYFKIRQTTAQEILKKAELEIEKYAIAKTTELATINKNYCGYSSNYIKGVITYQFLDGSKIVINTKRK